MLDNRRQPTIYVLHGWSTDNHTEQKWRPFLEKLQALGFKSHFFAIPGLTAPLNEVWTLDDYVRWLEKELQGQRDVILLGHSFGGQLAIRYAADHQRQLRQLILIDSSGIRDWAFKAKVKRRVFWVAAKIGKLFFNVPAARKILYRLARERDYLNAPPLLKRTMSLILDEEVIESAAALKNPTLLIWGENDAVTPLKIGKRFAKLITTSQLETIPKARHSPQYTHPQEAAQIIGKWLKNKEGQSNAR